MNRFQELDPSEPHLRLQDEQTSDSVLHVLSVSKGLFKHLNYGMFFPTISTSCCTYMFAIALEAYSG